MAGRGPGEWGGSGCGGHLGVHGEEAAPRPTLPPWGTEVKGLAEARPLARSPGGSRPSWGVAGVLIRWLVSGDRISWVKFQSSSGSWKQAAPLGRGHPGWATSSGRPRFLEARARPGGYAGAQKPARTRNRVSRALTPPRAEGRGPSGVDRRSPRRGQLGGEG